MSNVNNQFKELVNEAIHNHFHDKTEIEMILKDWLYGICEQADEYEAKAKAFDESLKNFKELERLHEEVRKVSKRNREKSEVYKEVLFHVIREMESNLGESGESDA